MKKKVAAELDSPEKVAAAIKAEIYGRNNTGETKAPVYPAEKEEKDTNNWWKILLIIVGGLFVLSIAGPIVLGVALTPPRSSSYRSAVSPAQLSPRL